MATSSIISGVMSKSCHDLCPSGIDGKSLRCLRSTSSSEIDCHHKALFIIFAKALAIGFGTLGARCSLRVSFETTSIASLNVYSFGPGSELFYNLIRL